MFIKKIKMTSLGDPFFCNAVYRNLAGFQYGFHEKNELVESHERAGGWSYFVSVIFTPSLSVFPGTKKHKN